MKIAIPLAQGELSPHFGHCEAFAFFTVEEGKVLKEEVVNPIEHGCGSYPQFLKEYDCNVLIAGGLGLKAKNNVLEQGIEVIHGVSNAPLKQLVEQYLAGNLISEGDLCNHEHGEHDESHCSHND